MALELDFKSLLISCDHMHFHFNPLYGKMNFLSHCGLNGTYFHSVGSPSSTCCEDDSTHDVLFQQMLLAKQSVRITTVTHYQYLDPSMNFSYGAVGEMRLSLDHFCHYCDEISTGVLSFHTYGH